MASNESNAPMRKPVEEMTDEEIRAEHEQIRQRRKEIDRQMLRTADADAAFNRPQHIGNGYIQADAGPTPQPVMGSSDPAAVLDTAMQIIRDVGAERAARDILAADDQAEDLDPPLQAEGKNPAPWPHQTTTLDDGNVLEYRKADPSALVAISMVSMIEDGNAQVRVLNTFMRKHLSPASLSYVLCRMTDPDDEFDLNALVTALNSDE